MEDSAADQIHAASPNAALPGRADPRTLVLVATYNERDNLPQLVDEIFQHAPDVNVLVIDDNSPDGTGRWCDERAAVDPRVHCIHRAGKLGLGTALIEGMKYAIGHNYVYLLSMDADFSHQPKYLRNLIEGMAGEDHPDVMIGSRYVPGGGVEGWPLKRHFMSRAVNIYARTFLGLKSRDCSGNFRCYRVSRLKQLDFSTIRAHGYAFQEEMLWQLKRLGCRLNESPIIFIDRVRGQSKIDAKEAYAALFTIARLGVRNLLHR